MRDAVKQFAVAMEDKLQAKDDERGVDGWLYPPCDIHYLIVRLEDEVRELKAAFEDCDPGMVKQETVDIGNFAMMIFDRLTKKGENHGSV